MNNNCYKVPIVPQGLCKEETIVQIAEVLEHLSNVTDDMFKRINLRLDSGGKKLSEISDRVDVATAKITKLVGSKKAIQIFSSSKYPGAHLSQPFESIFADLQPPQIHRRRVKLKKRTGSGDGADRMYHVSSRASAGKDARSGLGAPPADVRCVSDFLLYNSGKNLYEHFVMSDALVETRAKGGAAAEAAAGIGAAPLSISERSTVARPAPPSYFYTPSSGKVPALDVPIDLPDLPNVADDLRYCTDSGEEVEPLSDINIPVEAKIPDQIPLDDHAYAELPAPPEPTPQVDAEKGEDTPQVGPSVDERDKTKEAPVQSDLRSSLMDAIRKAGGAKNLKNVTENESSTRPKKPPGGDLMADLHAKLSMRRKGISGPKLNHGLDAGSALDRISAKIPPPVANDSEQNATDDNDEWDD